MFVKRPRANTYSHLHPTSPPLASDAARKEVEAEQEEMEKVEGCRYRPNIFFLSYVHVSGTYRAQRVK